MHTKSLLIKLVSLIVVMAMLLTTMVGCSTSPPPQLTDPNGSTNTENTLVENTITENILSEFITEEIYLKEMVLAEDKITELLLEEEMINEVTLCKTIYVPEENIEDFAEHSQTAQLFGEGFEIKDVLKKVAIGTGIIVTIAIVKKAGFPEEIGSVVAAAADESLKVAKSGAVVGTVFGAFTGAADEIDESGRIAAVTGFALATVGLIVSVVSLVGAIPSGGTSSFGVAEGVHLAWAGVKVLLATAGTAFAARDTIKAFKSTDVSEIDWDNVDWDQLGVAAAQKAIQNGADGYMWGAIYGAIDGGVEKYYQKFSTPYTQYKDRINHLKQMKKRGLGEWTGAEGESEFILKKPIVLDDGTVITKVTYQNGIPDFSPYAIAEVKIKNMTNERYSKPSKNIIGNFEKADSALAEQWTKIKYQGRKWSASDVKSFRESFPFKLTWHEMSNMESMQLVPFDVNDTFKHYGGVAEYNAMRGQKGAGDYD